MRREGGRRGGFKRRGGGVVHPFFA